MAHEWHAELDGVGAIGAALVGGVFFTFSTFVATALRRTAPAHAMPAMQEMNRAAPSSPLFMAALGGTAAVCVAIAVSAIRRLDEPVGRYELAASALYLTCVAVTAAFNVPRNEALAVVDPTGQEAAGAWARFLPTWVAWNHVRTLTALASSATFVLALRQRWRA